MADTINREAAINTVFSTLCKWDTKDPEDLKNMLLLAFQEMPSAEKVGKWIEVCRSLDKCSVCGDYVDFARQNGYNYCPNCGATMVKGADDE